MVPPSPFLPFHSPWIIHFLFRQREILPSPVHTEEQRSRWSSLRVQASLDAVTALTASRLIQHDRGVLEGPAGHSLTLLCWQPTCLACTASQIAQCTALSRGKMPSEHEMRYPSWAGAHSKASVFFSLSRQKIGKCQLCFRMKIHCLPDFLKAIDNA